MCVYREEPLVVLDEHQGHADDGRAVLDAHSVDVRVHVCSSLPLQQVGPKDHRQVGSRHLVPGNLDDKRKQTNRQKQERVTQHFYLKVENVTRFILFGSL